VRGEVWRGCLPCVVPEEGVAGAVSRVRLPQSRLVVVRGVWLPQVRPGEESCEGRRPGGKGGGALQGGVVVAR